MYSGYESISEVEDFSDAEDTEWYGDWKDPPKKRRVEMSPTPGMDVDTGILIGIRRIESAMVHVMKGNNK